MNTIIGPNGQKWIVTGQFHSCGSTVAIPMPLEANILPGHTVTFIECRCLDCNIPVLLTLGEYQEMYRRAKRSRKQLHIAGGAV